MAINMINKAEGYAINGDENHWCVECPECSKLFEYIGFFDSGEKTFCRCGCVFQTEKLWLNKKQYIT